MANAGLTEAAEQGRTQGPRSCIATDNIYRPLLDEKQYSTFTKAAQELPQWLEYLTREDFLEAVPGSDTKCLGGERSQLFLGAVTAPSHARLSQGILNKGCASLCHAPRSKVDTCTVLWFGDSRLLQYLGISRSETVFVILHIFSTCAHRFLVELI